MFSIGNGELGELLDNTIDCPHCGKKHDVKYGERILEDGSRVPDQTLAFYTCGGSTYLCGINGRKIK